MSDSNKILKEEGSSLIRNIAETIIDSTLTDGPLKDMPGIDMAFSSIKMIKSISDKILFQKLLEFINHLDLHSKEKVEKFKEKYFKLKDYPKIGKFLLLSLQQTNDEEKIKWKAKALIALINQEISKEYFFRISEILDRIYIADLREFKNTFGHSDTYTPDHKTTVWTIESLKSNGLIYLYAMDEGNASGTGSHIYQTTDIGEAFKKILF